jgi:O-acetyl-ADP-ribose deacetylase (regulator of RNase III)
MLRLRIGNSDLEIIKGDITNQDTEAVVNAANTRLAPGGGVAGAIHSAAGPELWAECKGLGGCGTGEAKITKAYNLPNKYVIHTVGPVYSGTESDAKLLESCYLNSLKLADEYEIKSISFPAISTGIFGYPLKEASEVAVRTISDYLKGATGIKLVRMVLYDEVAYQTHEITLKQYENI